MKSLFALLRLVFIWSLCALFGGCVNVRYPNGTLAFHGSANVGHVEITSGRFHFAMDGLDPATTHRAIGKAVSEGATGIGGSVAASGILGLFK